MKSEIARYGIAQVTLWTTLSVVALAYAAPLLGLPPKHIVSVETDYGGNPSDVSTDELFLKYSDGSREYLTRNKLMDRAASFSCDNTKIAFVRRNDTNGDGKVTWDDNSELVVMDLSSRKTICLSKGLLDAGMASWRSDKLSLVFDAKKGRKRKLFVYDVQTQKRQAIAPDVSGPIWSMDGKFIAFYDSKNRVGVIRPDGRERRVVTDDVGNGWGLRWTHDGALVFPYRDGWRRYDPKTTVLRKAKAKRGIDQSMYDWVNLGQPETPD